MRKRFVLLALPSLWLGLIAASFAFRSVSDTTHGAKEKTALAPASLEPVADTREESMAAAGRKVFVDPITGRIVPGPVQPAATPPLPPDHPLSTSGEGLQEVPVTARAGGMKVHLQGRFRSTVMATVGPDGKLTTQCQPQSEPDSPNTSK